MNAIHALPKRIVLAITGASGSAIGIKIAEILAVEENIELHVVLSPAGQRTILAEAGANALKKLKTMPVIFHHHSNIGASIASGSFKTHAMIVAPCSMRSLAAIASGIADNLIVRAADVQLKERGRLILMARETPLHLGHLRHMCAVTEMGGIIMPPMPAFYHKPKNMDELISDMALRAIGLLGLPLSVKARSWQGDEITIDE